MLEFSMKIVEFSMKIVEFSEHFEIDESSYFDLFWPESSEKCRKTSLLKSSTFTHLEATTNNKTPKL